MAKIVINKNFQSKYLYRAYERLVKPDYSIHTYISFGTRSGTNDSYNLTGASHIPYYNDLSSVYKTNWSGVSLNEWVAPTEHKNVLIPHQYFLCDETFLTLLNKLNKIIKDDITTLPKVVNSCASTAVTSGNKTANVNILYLVASLFSASMTVRNNTIDYFSMSNIISTSDAIQIKNTLSTLDLVDNNVSVNTYGYMYVPKLADITTNITNGLVDIEFNKVLRLDNPYKKSIDNVANNNLYILAIPFSDSKMSGPVNVNKILGLVTPGDISLNYNPFASYSAFKYEESRSIVSLGYTTFHNKATNTVVNQIPYIALSLTETGLGGDIEYDHLDEIEYLDEIKISIALPKEYV